MSFVPTVFTEAGMLPSQKLAGLQNIASQYSAAVDYIKSKTHAASYYDKSQCTAKYYPAAGGVAGMNCTKLGGWTYQQIVDDLTPDGVICFFQEETLPGGWVEDTEMAGLFPKGAAQGESVGPAGGSNNASPTPDTITIFPHQLTPAEISRHAHNYEDQLNVVMSVYASSGPNSTFLNNTESSSETEEAGGDVAHPHSATYTGELKDNRPPWHCLKAGRRTIT